MLASFLITVKLMHNIFMRISDGICLGPVNAITYVVFAINV